MYTYIVDMQGVYLKMFTICTNIAIYIILKLPFSWRNIRFFVTNITGLVIEIPAFLSQNSVFMTKQPVFLTNITGFVIETPAFFGHIWGINLKKF